MTLHLHAKKSTFDLKTHILALTNSNKVKNVEVRGSGVSATVTAKILEALFRSRATAETVLTELALFWEPGGPLCDVTLHSTLKGQGPRRREVIRMPFRLEQNTSSKCALGFGFLHDRLFGFKSRRWNFTIG